MRRFVNENLLTKINCTNRPGLKSYQTSPWGRLLWVKGWGGRVVYFNISSEYSVSMKLSSCIFKWVRFVQKLSTRVAYKTKIKKIPLWKRTEYDRLFQNKLYSHLWYGYEKTFDHKKIASQKGTRNLWLRPLSS